MVDQLTRPTGRLADKADRADTAKLVGPTRTLAIGQFGHRVIWRFDNHVIWQFAKRVIWRSGTLVIGHFDDRAL